MNLVEEVIEFFWSVKERRRENCYVQGRSEDLEMGPTLMEGDTWIWTELRGGLLIMESLI